MSPDHHGDIFCIIMKMQPINSYFSTQRGVPPDLAGRFIISQGQI